MAVENVILPLAAQLLSELCACLAAHEVPVCHCCFTLKIPATADHCCKCPSGIGHAWLGMATAYPSGRFPVPLQTAVECPEPYTVAVMTMGVWRCQTIPSDGSPPTCDEKTANFARALGDGAIMRSVARKVLAERTWTPGNWEMLEPEGMCYGGMFTFSVATEDCGECD